MIAAVAITIYYSSSQEAIYNILSIRYIFLNTRLDVDKSKVADCNEKEIDHITKKLDEKEAGVVAEQHNHHHRYALLLLLSFLHTYIHV